ncbi:MAG: AAA family ATPase [Gemmatales bacterium]|nr:AAA family ATPase [Gemmatales bacterium]MDW7995734.1 AAA family ATPase [Gemmatales bacterium]
MHDTERQKRLEAARQQLATLLRELHQVIIGQDSFLEGLILGLLCGGHVLVEGVPGLAKTLAVRTLAAALQLPFSRIQFTPDLLPADILGTQIYQPRTGEFTIRKGPIFASLVLADEINRAPAKVQSALLQAMQERQVTIGEETFPLPRPFFVLATQNPIEHEGTYPLPEAQTDRFLLKLLLQYPSRDEEVQILERMAHVEPQICVQPVLDGQQVLQLQACVEEVYLDARLKRYIVDLVQATRQPESYGLDLRPWIQYGASPRGTIGLALASKAKALLAGRDYVLPADIHAVAPLVLRHRILLSYEAEAQNWTTDRLIQHLLQHLPPP